MVDEQQMTNTNLTSRKLPSWQEMQVEAMRIGLEGTEVFKMVDDETKKVQWNGIGADRTPKFLRKLFDKLFVEALSAAYIHDLRFFIGGSKLQFYDSNSELKRNLYKCLRFYRKHYSLLGYWNTKIQINIAVWLCNKYGYEGWHKH